MRDSNYKSAGQNRAAITITTSLYDRRALDVTSDKPLVNSLNHLTYLVSSLAKVRETLSVDGGIERLIEILHECHNSTFNIKDTIFNSEKKMLTAWKWTLSFQCIVLIGTRGTETIRKRVVKAGILPIIATILDNYIVLHENILTPSSTTRRIDLFGNESIQSQIVQPQPMEIFNEENSPIPSSATTNGTGGTEGNDNSNLRQSLNFLNQFGNEDNLPNLNQLNTSPSFSNHIPSNFNQSLNGMNSIDYENLTVDELLRLVRNDVDSDNINEIVRKKYLILIILKKLKEEKDDDLLDTRFSKEFDYEMDNNLQFLSDLYLQDDKLALHNNLSRVAPRQFTETGVVIPRDDDIVWSLQLLAYISKYPGLKESLQNSHFVIDMSVRDKQIKLGVEKELKLKLKKTLEIKQRPTIKPKSRKSKLLDHSNTGVIMSRNDYNDNEDSKLGFSASASNSPQMLNGINSLQEDNFVLEQDKLGLCDETDGPTEDGLRVENADVEDVEDIENGESDPEFESDSDYSGSDGDNNFGVFPSYFPNKLSALYESIYDCEGVEDDLERGLLAYDLSEELGRSIITESKNLRLSIIKKRLEQKQYLEEKWNYDNYKNFDIDCQPGYLHSEKSECSDPDYDDSLIEYETVNLFPMVERFTCLSGTDMYYWSGVIMRNSCRRNDNRGGVRQCGNLQCGRWELYSREFSKCRRCKRTKYCSRECQMRAWQCHRNWCIPSSSSSNTNTNNTNNDNVANNTIGENLNPGAVNIVVDGLRQLNDEAAVRDEETPDVETPGPGDNDGTNDI